MAELLNARKMRDRQGIQIDLGDGTFVKARREDMTLLVFEGRVPMPMLAAVQKMIELPDASPMERIQSLGAENGRTLVEVLRDHACRVVLEPKIVREDDGDPDHLPVEFLDTQKLMAIWMKTAVIPEVTNEDAATFRPERSLHAVAPAPTRPNLPAITQQLDTPDVEFVSG
jgi:hypothetical protein